MLLAACGDDDVPAPVLRRDFPPPRYGYLPPINLNVQRVEMAEGFVPASGDDEVSFTQPVDPAQTLFAMARDRLRPVATSGTATFSILTASIKRHRDTLNGVLAVRLDVRDADGANSGFVEARVTAAHSGEIPDQRAAVYDMLKSMMDDMNVEFEFQVRKSLRDWLVTNTAVPAPISSASLAHARTSRRFVDMIVNASVNRQCLRRIFSCSITRSNVPLPRIGSFVVAVAPSRLTFNQTSSRLPNLRAISSVISKPLVVTHGHRPCERAKSMISKRSFRRFLKRSTANSRPNA